MRLRIAAPATLLVAALSLVVVAGVPSYDPWMWLLWGRELTHLDLSTAEGPAFKPLPVAAGALLAPFGGAAPLLWVLLARWAAVATLVLAYVVGRRIAGGSRAAGVAAAACVAFTEGFLGYAAAGNAEPILLAFALAAALLAASGAHRAALACVAACALLRVEAWPFAAAYGIWLWRRGGRGERTLLAALAILLPALWLVPELLGSGDPLRSGSRALQPNPGQPALAPVPAWASLREAVGLPPWPVWLGVAALVALVVRGAGAGADAERRFAAAGWLAAAGAAWIALVAAMAQAGFSGEPRYALPGAALLAIAAAAPLAAASRSSAAAGRPTRGPTAALALALAVVAVAAVPRLGTVEAVRDGQRYQADLASDLRAVVADAGGRDALLACGGAYVGDFRGPLLAYALAVEKRRVEFEPGPPGVVFTSRRTRHAPVEPAVPPDFHEIARNATWTVLLGAPNTLPRRCRPPASVAHSSPPAQRSSSRDAATNRTRAPRSSR